MTYNFDPDKWFDNELLMIQSKLKNGELSETEYDKEVELLDKKYQDMWKRLDGSYQINFDK